MAIEDKYSNELISSVIHSLSNNIRARSEQKTITRAANGHFPERAAPGVLKHQTGADLGPASRQTHRRRLTMITLWSGSL